MANSSRTVIYEDYFLVALKSIEPDNRRADEFMVAVEWALCRHPEEGMRAYHNSKIWILSMPELVNMPPLTIYYNFDDKYVYLLFVELGSYGVG